MLKMLIKRLATLMIFTALLAVGAAEEVFASGSEESGGLLDGVSAESVCVRELGTGQNVCERAADKTVSMGHFAKLMTALICAEEIEGGKVTLSEEIAASSYANSMPAPQIWLMPGERVTVEELLKSIIMGNANDACAALAERLSGSAEAHVFRMNERAAALGMSRTHFEDCMGLDERSVTTAADLCLLSEEVLKHDILGGYFTAWQERVRNGETELVNTNRLVRDYKGACGLKFFAAGGKCNIIGAVRRRDMIVCAVIVGSESRERIFSEAEGVFDGVFEKYSVFSPEISEELTADIPVEHGRVAAVRVRAENDRGVLLGRGTASRAQFKAEISERVTAPIAEGDVLGRVVYTLDDTEIMEIHICAAEPIGRMDMRYGIYRALCNLCRF